MFKTKKFPNMVILTIILLGSFLFLNKVIAVFDYTFETYSAIDNPSDFKWSDYSASYGLQKFKVGADGALQNIILEWKGPAADKATVDPILLWDDTLDSVYWLVSQSTGTTTAESPFISFATTSGYVIMDSANDYVLRIQNTNYGVHSASTTYENDSNWDDSDSNSDGTLPADQNWFNFSGATIDADIYMRLGISGEIPDSQVWFNQTPSSTCNFSNIRINFQLNQTDLDAMEAGDNALSFIVAYGTTPDYLPYYLHADPLTGEPVIQTIYASDLSSGQVYSQWVNSPEQFVYGMPFYGKAYLCSSATSSNCDFTVGENDSYKIAESALWGPFLIPDDAQDVCPSNYFPVFEAEQVNPFGSNQTTCDSANSWWDLGLCKMWNFLIVPDQSNLQKFANLKNSIANKPPFGYFNAYKTQFDSLSTTTSSTIDLVVGNDYNDITGDLRSITIFDTIYTAISWLLWFLFGVWIFQRFRHFSL